MAEHRSETGEGATGRTAENPIFSYMAELDLYRQNRLDDEHMGALSRAFSDVVKVSSSVNGFRYIERHFETADLPTITRRLAAAWAMALDAGAVRMGTPGTDDERWMFFPSGYVTDTDDIYEIVLCANSYPHERQQWFVLGVRKLDAANQQQVLAALERYQDGLLDQGVFDLPPWLFFPGDEGVAASEGAGDEDMAGEDAAREVDGAADRDRGDGGDVPRAAAGEGSGGPAPSDTAHAAQPADPAGAARPAGANEPAGAARSGGRRSPTPTPSSKSPSTARSAGTTQSSGATEPAPPAAPARPAASAFPHAHEAPSAPAETASPGHPTPGQGFERTTPSQAESSRALSGIRLLRHFTSGIYIPFTMKTSLERLIGSSGDLTSQLDAGLSRARADGAFTETSFRGRPAIAFDIPLTSDAEAFSVRAYVSVTSPGDANPYKKPWILTHYELDRRMAAASADGTLLGELASQVHFDSWSDSIRLLSRQIMPEGDDAWSIKRDVVALGRALSFTYSRVRKAGKLAVNEERGSAAFDTGFMDRYFQPIYALLTRYRPGHGGADHGEDAGEGREFEWEFVAFCTAWDGISGLQLGREFDPLPQPLTIADEPERYAFDVARPIHMSYYHMVQQHAERFPVGLLESLWPEDEELRGLLANVRAADPWDAMARVDSMRKMATAMHQRPAACAALRQILDRAVERARQMAALDPRIAIPAFYPRNDADSFLLPLCFGESDRVDLALVVSVDPQSGAYCANTFYTLDMARKPARYVGRAASTWLYTGSVFGNAAAQAGMVPAGTGMAAARPAAVAEVPVDGVRELADVSDDGARSLADSEADGAVGADAGIADAGTVAAGSGGAADGDRALGEDAAYEGSETSGSEIATDVAGGESDRAPLSGVAGRSAAVPTGPAASSGEAAITTPDGERSPAMNVLDAAGRLFATAVTGLGQLIGSLARHR